MVYRLLLLILIAGQAKAQMISSSAVLRTDTATGMSILSPRRSTATLLSFRNGYVLTIPQDSIYIPDFMGKNHATADSLLVFDKGFLYPKAKTGITWPYSQVTGAPTTWAYTSISGSRLPSTVTRSFNAAFTPSATRDVHVSYNVSIAAALTLTGGQTGNVFLEISSNGSTWLTVGTFSNGNTGTLTIGLSLINTQSGQLSFLVPAGYQVRLRTTSTGSPTITYVSGFETAI